MNSMAECEFVESKEVDYTFKTVQLGKHGVGKSSLLIRFAENSFEKIYMMVNDLRVKTIKFDNKIIKLLMWDEPVSKERYRTISPSYYRGSDGIFIIFDVTDHDSFEFIGEYLREINIYVSDKIPKILIGNKCDLSEKRVVSTEDGKEYALKWNLEYIETSAKTGQNVHHSVLVMVKKMIMSKDNEITNELTVPKEKASIICVLL
eukprot:291549_1